MCYASDLGFCLLNDNPDINPKQIQVYNGIQNGIHVYRCNNNNFFFYSGHAYEIILDAYMSTLSTFKRTTVQPVTAIANLSHPG